MRNIFNETSFYRYESVHLHRPVCLNEVHFLCTFKAHIDKVIAVPHIAQRSDGQDFRRADAILRARAEVPYCIAVTIVVVIGRQLVKQTRSTILF